MPDAERPTDIERTDATLVHPRCIGRCVVTSNRSALNVAVAVILVSGLALSTVVSGVAAPTAVSYPPGYDAHHVNSTRALTQHTNAVTASTSVHTNLSYVATASGGASIHHVEAWTDYEQDTQLVDARAIYATGRRYTADGIVYTNVSVTSAENARYDRKPGDILTNRSTGTDTLAKVLPYLDFELQKTTVENGQRLFTYRATNFDSERFSIITRYAETVRSYNATLTVDERGRIHTFTFDLDAWGDDGNLLTVETSINLNGFGRTTVPQPEWVRTEFQ